MRLQPLLLASAVLLMGAGAVALFAPDEVAALVGVPAGSPSRTLVQLLAGALFGLGMFDWMNRYTTIGGIYGRPVVVANFAFFFIATTTLARAVGPAGGGIVPWGATIACGALAVLYGWLLFGGGPRRNAA